MSHTIEYTGKVFKLPKGTKIPSGLGKEEHSLMEDEYFIFTKSGCNNIDPRPKHWQLTASGWNYQVIATICERAGWTEGGLLTFPSGDTTPEAYLELYRRKIKSAPIFSILALQKSTGIYGGYYCLGNKHQLSADWVSNALDKLKEWFSPYGEYRGYFRYEITFSSLEHFRAFLNYRYILTEMGGYYGLSSYHNHY